MSINSCCKETKVGEHPKHTIKELKGHICVYSLEVVSKGVKENEISDVITAGKPAHMSDLFTSEGDTFRLSVWCVITFRGLSAGSIY